jgi:Flp pilus assembly protein CpaB
LTPKRTIVVVAALGVALLAGGLSYLFLRNAQEQAFRNAKLVPAYVVTKSIPRGMAGADAARLGYFSEKSVPSEIVPPNAVTDLSVLGGKTAIANLPPGEVLVAGMFVSPAQANLTFSQVIPAGEVAIAVSVDAVHGVANLPQPGDKVDLLTNVNGDEAYLLQNVSILAVGENTAGQAGGSTTTASSSATPNSSGLYTFAASPQDASRIALAEQENLGIYLVLVPPNNPVVSVPEFSQANLLSGAAS